MSRLSLETLLLSDEELRVAHREVEKLAYRKWKEAGGPEGRDGEFWRAAELEWIEYYYVPDRKSSAARRPKSP